MTAESTAQEFLTREQERRRNPRYLCGGLAQITCLPSAGVLLGGELRNLGLGGCYIETITPFALGARAEMVLRVNSLSFRALGQIRAVRERGGIGVEFLRLSASGRSILAELLLELQRQRALRRAANPAHQEDRRELLRLYPENRWATPLVPSRSVAIVGTVLPRGDSEAPSGLQSYVANEDLLSTASLLDLFI